MHEMHELGDLDNYLARKDDREASPHGPARPEGGAVAGTMRPEDYYRMPEPEAPSQE